jgi:hypothetical protein
MASSVVWYCLLLKLFASDYSFKLRLLKAPTVGARVMFASAMLSGGLMQTALA